MRVIFLISLVIFSCTQNTSEDEVQLVNNQNVNNDHVEKVDSTSILLKELTEKKFNSIGLVDIQSVNKNILIDLRYATENNFMNVVLYDTLQVCFLQKEVAEKLSRCQRYLDSIRPGFKLKVFDGVRPLNIQFEMWNALDSIPPLNRGKFVSNPARGSVHNFGAAVDLTIVDSNLVELDMGAGYDDFREIAFPKLESRFLNTGELSEAQVDNRKLLRKVMRSQNFRNIPTEWWHFNAYSRYRTSHKFQMVLSESGDVKWSKLTLVKDTTNNIKLTE